MISIHRCKFKFLSNYTSYLDPVNKVGTCLRCGHEPPGTGGRISHDRTLAQQFFSFYLYSSRTTAS